MAEPIRSRDDLANYLANQISRGKLRAGQALPSERALAEEYGLSRSMVREALRTLAERRLIEVSPGRRSIVREATVDDAVERIITFFDHRGITIRNLIEARAMMETVTAGLAAERATDEEIAVIVEAQRALDRTTNVLERIRWDVAFHLAIVRAAGNPLIETMFRAIQPYIVELLLRSLTDEVVTREGLAFHGRILQAIGEHDPATAIAEMQGHITVGLPLFGTDVDRNLDLVAQDALEKISSGPISVEEILELSRNR